MGSNSASPVSVRRNIARRGQGYLLSYQLGNFLRLNRGPPSTGQRVLLPVSTLPCGASARAGQRSWRHLPLDAFSLDNSATREAVAENGICQKHSDQPRCSFQSVMLHAFAVSLDHPSKLRRADSMLRPSEETTNASRLTCCRKATKS